MFEIVAQREGATALGAKTPTPAQPPAPEKLATPVVPAPELVVEPRQPDASPASSARPSETAPSPAAPSAPVATAQDQQPNLDEFARSISFEVQRAAKSPEPEISIATQEQLDEAVRRSADAYVREQLATQLQSMAEEIVRQKLESSASNLDEASGRLRKRLEEEAGQIADGLRGNFRQSLEKELEVCQSQAASTAAVLERLRAQAAKDFEQQKADLRGWVVAFQTSYADSAAAAAEEALSGLRAQVGSDFQTRLAAAQGALDVQFDHTKRRMAELMSELEGKRADALYSLTTQTENVATAAEEVSSRLRVQMDNDFKAKLAAAQSALDVKSNQAKHLVAELLNHVEECRAAGLSSLAEVTNAQAQMQLLRQNLKSEMASVESKIAHAAEEARTRLSAETQLRIAGGLNQIDAELQAKQTAFRESISKQLEAAREQGAGILGDLEACRANTMQSLQSVESTRQSIEQQREAWQAEVGSEEAKLQDVSRRVLLCASAEVSRLLNTAMGGLEVKLRERIAELEASCNGVVAQAARQLETTAAGVKKSETAAAGVLANVDASLSRSTQTLDALNALQASLTSNVQQLLAVETKKLLAHFQKHLQEQCSQLVASQVSTLGRQAALHVHEAEQALQRLSTEKNRTEAAFRMQKEMLHAETVKAAEEFRSGVAQTTERLKSEVENATRQAHEVLEQEFSLKIKLLADNTNSLVRRLFQPPSGTE